MNKFDPVDDLRFNPETACYRREDGKEFHLAHDPELDLWISPDGAQYVQNLNRIADPVYLRVDSNLWQVRHLGDRQRLDWMSLELPKTMSIQFKSACIDQLRYNASSNIGKWRSMLICLGQSIDSLNLDLDRQIGEWSSLQVRSVMLHMRATSVRHSVNFRSLYRTLVEKENSGCTQGKLEQLEQVRLVGGETLAKVRAWDPESGALTTAELETLRRNLLPPDHEETDTEHFARVNLRTLTALGRRPNQLLGVAADGIARPKHDKRLPAVVWVPGAKAQRNDPPRPYDLPDDLFEDLMRFALRPKIQDAQKHFELFFVTPITAQTRVGGPKDVGNCTTQLKDWIARVGIISPRTGKPLHITPTRLRHTVATQLARKGWSKEDIQEFLEHRGDSAVLAYLDAVGNDLTPALERAERALGGVFADLTNTFQGKVVPRPVGKVQKPIVVPSPKNKAVIGQCGLAGTCPKSPFAGCLGGCAHFLFFKDADVAAARDHIHGEHERWRAAEGNAQRARAHDDFARMDAGLLEAQKAAEVTDEQE